MNALPSSQDITRVELPNGITVLARPNFHSQSVIINGYLHAGAIYDPPEKLGLADFTADMLLNGTHTRDYHTIHNLLETAAASLGFSANIHTTSFSGRSLVEDLDLLLELLHDAVQTPTFPDEQITRLRARALTNHALREQSAGAQAAIAFDQIVYAGHPYAHPTDGYAETITRITREDIAAFHRAHYGPKGMTITIVGGIEPAKAVEKVAKWLGKWTNPEQVEIASLPEYRPPQKSTTRVIEIPDKSQASIVVGTWGPTRHDPKFMAASLGNHVLGQFGLNGRIGEVVRERAGLAYAAYSAISAGIGPGTWSVSAGVAPENVDAAIQLILREIARFVEGGITTEELTDSQANYIGSLPLTMESNAGVAASLSSIERYQLGLDYYTQYEAQVNAVRPEDVQTIAQKYLNPSTMTITIAGPSGIG